MPRMAESVDAHLRRRPTARARRWVGSILGGEVVATRRLKGGISTNTRAVTVARSDGSTRKAVLRTFVGPGWITAEPDLAAREAALLQVLEGAGVPAPRLLGVDAEGEASGSISLLMTLEPGRPVNDPVDRRPWIAGLVDAVGRVHAVAPSADPQPAGPSQAHRAPRHARRDRSATACRSTRSSGRRSCGTGPAWPARHRRCCTTTTTRATSCGPAVGSRASSTGPAPGFGQPASDVCYLRQDVSLVCGPGGRATRWWRPTRRPAARPVPDRPFWDLLAATRAKGAEEWWWGSYADFGLPVTLAEVRSRLDALIAAAPSPTWADADALAGAARRAAATVPAPCGCSSTARAPAFQAGGAGSIPVTRSSPSPRNDA